MTKPGANAAKSVRLAVLGSGAGTTAERVISACRSGEILGDVVVVIHNNTNSGIRQLAEHWNVPAHHLSGRTHTDPNELDAAMRDVLTSYRVTDVLLAGYMKKLGPLTLDAYSGRILNTHPALLPDFGGQGMYGDRVHQAVWNSDSPVAGATVHLVTAEYDAGPIIDQRSVTIDRTQELSDLKASVQETEKELVVDVLKTIALHRLAHAERPP